MCKNLKKAAGIRGGKASWIISKTKPPKAN